MWETIKETESVHQLDSSAKIWPGSELVGCSYRVKSKSVIVEGTAEIVDDYGRKERIVKRFL